MSFRRFGPRTNGSRATPPSARSCSAFSSRSRLFGFSGLAEQTGDERLGDALVEGLVGADRCALLLDVRLDLARIRLAIRRVAAVHAPVVAQQSLAQRLRRDFTGIRFHILFENVD